LSLPGSARDIALLFVVNQCDLALALALTLYNCLINLLMQDKKRVLKEFEWFEVQTKVRQIVGDILDPLEKMVLANSSAIGRLEDGIGEEKEKVAMLTKMVRNDPDIFERGIFRTIEEKFKKSHT
jgi:hypothetical protein